jgi:hypothetical protein
MEMTLNATVCGEAFGPVRAEVTVDETRLARLARLAQAADVAFIEDWDYGVQWIFEDEDENEDYHIDAPRLVVSRSGFWYAGYIKHTDVRVETSEVPFSSLGIDLSPPVATAFVAIIGDQEFPVPGETRDQALISAARLWPDAQEIRVRRAGTDLILAAHMDEGVFGGFISNFPEDLPPELCVLHYEYDRDGDENEMCVVESTDGEKVPAYAGVYSLEKAGVDLEKLHKDLIS